MKAILSPSGMKQADLAAMQILDISSWQLMELAARAASDVVVKLLSRPSRILVLCGMGNNGGDGFAMARMLAAIHRVTIVWLGDWDSMSAETRDNAERCRAMSLAMYAAHSTEAQALLHGQPFDVILDALIGIGGSHVLREPVMHLLEQQQSMKALRIAVDMPTGLNGQSGEAHPGCFQADHTISMACRKTGMCLDAGPRVCGTVHVVDIGIPCSILERYAEFWTADNALMQRLFTPRERNSSKFDYGRLCIVAGSRNMPGAAALCANAAIQSGVGIVDLCAPVFHAAVAPEILQTHCGQHELEYFTEQEQEELLEHCTKADAVVLGCGGGSAEATTRVYAYLLENIPETTPVVVDADALRAIPLLRRDRRLCIITPHAGEFRHLAPEVSTLEQRREFAEHRGYTLVYKAQPVEIHSTKRCAWNLNGNPGMATAGSGDVLAGVMGAMLARCWKNVEGATLEERLFSCSSGAVYLHAAAGDWAASHYGQESMTASHEIEGLAPSLMAMLERGNR